MILAERKLLVFYRHSFPGSCRTHAFSFRFFHLNLSSCHCTLKQKCI